MDPSDNTRKGRTPRHTLPTNDTTATGAGSKRKVEQDGDAPPPTPRKKQRQAHRPVNVEPSLNVDDGFGALAPAQVAQPPVAQHPTAQPPTAQFPVAPPQYAPAPGLLQPPTLPLNAPITRLQQGTLGFTNTNPPLLRTRTVNSGLRAQWKANWVWSDLPPGYIIRAPFHETLLDPNVDMNDPEVAKYIAVSSVARISSKPRPAIVLAAFNYNMLVMPLTTRSGRSLSDLPEHLQREYIAVRYKEGQELDHGYYDIALQAVMAPGEDLKEHSSVRLTHVATVNYKENVTRIGALEEDSINWLLRHWREFVDDAEVDGWEVEKKLLEQGISRKNVAARQYARFNNASKASRR
ncbi:hypothetical protein HII31_08392 [Pseudocercospora fuligena]|uniref:DUF6590 domain-containing protein n=1 Tax=Pseudocercospora fuligena TaxID=685502 RepID=A0A8H6RFB2_9PEZI|nr:hypothetical protein HII31_08392 [Pseudocercospora fuligena]